MSERGFTEHLETTSVSTWELAWKDVNTDEHFSQEILTPWHELKGTFERIVHWIFLYHPGAEIIKISRKSMKEVLTIKSLEKQEKRKASEKP